MRDDAGHAARRALARRPRRLPAHRERLAADLRQVLDDFQALRAEPSFPGLEDTLATLAARVRQGEEADDEQALARGLWSLSTSGSDGSGSA